jgi:hypothetical protein
MSVWDADKAAVKRDLEEFKKDNAKMQRYFHSALAAGYFVALDHARVSGLITKAMFDHEYRRYYDVLLPHISAARKVVPHIRMALDCLEMVCHQGRERRHIESVSAFARSRQFEGCDSRASGLARHLLWKLSQILRICPWFDADRGRNSQLGCRLLGYLANTQVGIFHARQP